MGCSFFFHLLEHGSFSFCYSSGNINLLKAFAHLLSWFSIKAFNRKKKLPIHILITNFCLKNISVVPHTFYSPDMNVYDCPLPKNQNSALSSLFFFLFNSISESERNRTTHYDIATSPLVTRSQGVPFAI